jgi:hypothetical protein
MDRPKPGLHKHTAGGKVFHKEIPNAAGIVDRGRLLSELKQLEG